VLILLDQVNDLSKSAKSIIEYYCIVYLVFVGVFKKNVTHQAWRALFQFGEYLFQSTCHFGECLKKMVSHTVLVILSCLWHIVPVITKYRFVDGTP
jgi:hypothetical protein